MNSDNDTMRDPLKEFITSDLCEKAPDGFSEKVMAGVTVMTTSEQAVQKKSLFSVPVIALAITLSLILAAFLLRGTGTTSAMVKLISSTLGIIPEIKTGKVFQGNLPLITGYVAAGVVILLIFDKLLFRFFNRKKQAHSQA